MRDNIMSPETTQLGYYLRTGRVLPAEYFATHKSQELTFGEDDFLSNKSWTTRDFWDHYKEGSRRTVNLGSILVGQHIAVI